jgi:nicotinamidase-related amidase
MSTPFSESRPFLKFLAKWQADLPSFTLNQAIPNPNQTAVICVDMINGFCHFGALSSPRVHSIIESVVALFQSTHAAGVPHFLLTQDTHVPDAVEFGQFPPHCVRGTLEAETVPEIRSLPFFDQMVLFEKNSIQAGLNTGLNDWLVAHPAVDTFILVGDCTDLCIYQLAMHLRLDANARQLQRRVMVPAECSQTYDISVPLAAQIGAMPHDGNLLHSIFLYHMALNGVEVVAEIS